MSLRLLLDSADPQAWRKWIPSGLFAGITTNPSLLRRANQPCRIEHLQHLVDEAKQLGCQELHLQAWGQNSDELIQCGTAIAALARPGMHLHLKLPVTKAGSQAASQLIAAGSSVTFTACYEIHQVLIAAALGATYIAPYLGRINDQGHDGIAALTTMQRVLDGMGSNCKLLVASLRQRNELSQLAAAGISDFTISPKLAEELFDVPATLSAAAAFEQDAAAGT